jgi:hypothetical protein
MTKIQLSLSFVMKSLFVMILDLVALYIALICSVKLIETYLFKCLKNNGAFYFLIFLIIWSFYYLILFRRTGQTLLMKLFKLKVRNNRNDTPSIFIALGWMFFMNNPFSTVMLTLYAISYAQYRLMDERDVHKERNGVRPRHGTK